MQNGFQSNAMAEIALALAMAFFSIMVLTMVSMGSGFVDTERQVKIRPEGLAILPSSASNAETANPGIGEAVSRDSIVIYYQGRFLDADLKEIDPADAKIEGQLILAVEPALPMTAAMAVRKQLPVEDLIVTTLDEHWLEALQENSK